MGFSSAMQALFALVCITGLSTVFAVKAAGSPVEVTLYEPPPGTAGNSYNDGDEDSSQYVYDPSASDDSVENTLPDKEGQAPPVPHWHACRFEAKAGGIYDLRPMMRLASTLEQDWIHKDATQSSTTYYLNICANTMAVPAACQSLRKKDPSPAYQVSSNGNCYYLGTLKTFKWKPIDSTEPGKGMVLAYQNGERCSNGRTRQIKYTIACSQEFGYDDGPMVVYETRAGCHYDVHWPNKAGCPINGGAAAMIDSIGAGSWGPGSVFLIVLLLALFVYVCGGCFYKMKFEEAEGIEACPHHTFWCALPAVFMACCQWVHEKLTGANSSRAGFSRVPTTASTSQYGASQYGASDATVKDDMF